VTGDPWSIPMVGLPSEDDGSCKFAPTPSDPTCSKPAVIHILGRAKGWGNVSLATCVEHAGIAFLAVDISRMHSYSPNCCPGVRDEKQAG